MKNMNRFVVFLVCLITLPTAFAQDLIVLVNKHNPVTEMSKQQLRSYLLRKEVLWANKQKVVPIIPTAQNAGYATLLGQILKMDKPTYDRYLIEMKFKSGLSPAKEMEESFIPNVVGVALGAIGVVSRGSWSASPEAMVKAIEIVE